MTSKQPDIPDIASATPVGKPAGFASPPAGSGQLPPMVMSAYQCGPGMGSVSQIGWEWFVRTARLRPVTLVTHVRNQTAIEAEGPLPKGAEITYIDTEWFAGPLYRLAKRLFPNSEHGVFLVSSLDFFVFDAMALRRLQQQKTSHNWRVLHVVTPVTLSAPSRLHRLGLPTVWGPLNCGLESPPGFERILRHEKAWLIRLRELPKLLDGWMGTTRHTQVLLTATQAAKRAVPTRHRHRCIPLLENGVDLDRFSPTPWPQAPSAAHPLQVLFVGRMIALKGVDMLLEAAAALMAQGIPFQLTLVGDGPQREEWSQKSLSLGLGHCVVFTGALTAHGVAQHMQACHVFCLPSVRESGGAVLLEAMACARPIVAVAYGGPAEIVDEAVGHAIVATNYDDVVRQLSDVLADVTQHPQHWAQRGRQGLQRIREQHDWNQKIANAQEIYELARTRFDTPR